jgi:hypothetical protein
MAGQGKYTQYVPNADPKYNLLGRLFKGSEQIESPFAKHVEDGDQEAARVETIDRCKPLLQPNVQQGDLGFFPQGVHLDWKHPDAPTTHSVVWEKAGDPANPFMADISSPGPGRTEGVDKDVDPKITVEDIEGVAYVPGSPNTTTRDPAQTAEPLHAENELGKPGTPGKNSAGEPSGF